MRDTYTTDQYYETYYYESFPPRVEKCRRLRRPVFSRPGLRRRYTFPPSSNTSDTDPEDLYWIQSPRTRARTFAPQSERSDFITVDMDRHRRTFWRSLFGLEYFDVYRRRKRETQTRHEHESPRPTPRARLPRDRYDARPVGPGYWDEHRWEGPRINPPRRAPSPSRSRQPRRRSDSLRRRVHRSISPESPIRRHSYDRPRHDVRRPPEPEPQVRSPSFERPRGDVRRPPKLEPEPTDPIPRSRPTRPSSPIRERGPLRPGRYISPGPIPRPRPSSRPPITIIQPTPRAVSPLTNQSNTPSHPTTRRPRDADIITHSSFRERMNRKRIHSPKLSSPPRSRKVRFCEGHEEIPGPIWFNSDSDSSSDSDSASDSDSESRPGPSRANTRSGPRPSPRYGPVVVNQIVERRPSGSQGGGGESRGRVSTGDVRRGSLQERVGREDVSYVVREPRDTGRRRDFRRHI